MRPLAHPQPCAGFSLIELVIVLAVIGVLGAAAALFLRGPIALNSQLGRQAELIDQAGRAGLWLERELAAAMPNSVTRVPHGAGFRLSFALRPPASGTVQYTCAPNAANPAMGSITRDPGNRLLARHVAACQAMDPQASAYRGGSGRDQTVALAYTLRSGEQQVDVWQVIRVQP